jgi:sugar transferase (PEP-CTERM system associated)
MIRIFNQYFSPKVVVLILLESALIVLALLCAVRIRLWDDSVAFNSYVALRDFAPQAIVFAGTLQVCFYCCDLYNLNALGGRPERLLALGQALGAGYLLLGGIYFVFPDLLLGRGILFITAALIPAFLILSRAALDRVWHAARKENVLILGTDRLACAVAREFGLRNDLQIQLVGFVSAEHAGRADSSLAGRPILGSADELVAIVAQYRIARIVVALDDRRNTLPVSELVRLRIRGIRVEDATTAVSALTGRVWLETLEPSWFMFSDGFRRSRVTLFVKRVIDLACGMAGLIVSLPIMVAVAIAIRLDSKGPVIYRQTRVGWRGKWFEVLKFRSMRVDAEAGIGAQWAASNDTRVTRVGHYLRKYRLDELPQFINVIRGDMSFVGPRPERPEFVENLRKHISYYDERHTVRPGLTGWAQVSYKYGSSTEDAARKMEYDLFYLKNMSPFFDCAIIFDTVRIVTQGQEHPVNRIAPIGTGVTEA